MNISRKLVLGFVTVALLAGLTGGFGLWRMSQMSTQAEQVESRYVPGVIALGDVRSQLGDFRIFEVGLIQNHDQPQMVTDFTTRMSAARERVLSRMQEYEVLMGGLDNRELATSAHAAIERYFDSSSRIILHVMASEPEAAQGISDAESRPHRRAMAQSLEDLIEGNRTALTASVAEGNAAYRNAVWTLLAASLLAVAAGVGLALLISRAIATPLRDAVSMAEAIARGDLAATIQVRSNDETGRLARAMQDMVAALRDFDGAQREMAMAHDAGAIDARMDESRFQGTFAELAAQTNSMVASHLAVQQRMAEVVDAYARGDFRQDMDRLPGQKARITEAMDQVKANLGAIKDDTLRLSEAAGRGDFSARGDVDAYQFAFADMVGALNTLMEQADAGLCDVGAVLKALAEGDLTQTVDGNHQGAFGELAASTNQTIGQLRAIVERIHEATGAINIAASEISSGNADLSRRTESQAASLEETASSMEELTATVKQNAEHSRRARELATGAAGVATSGGGVVEQVVSTMSEISASSRRIEEIIGVIDGITFQTNILALNAAVEAARAGEQGRGFAVVASEVRTLAQRSADAAKQIKELIEASGSQVDVGVKLVNQAGATMNRLVESVGEVNEIVGEIASASDEQAAGIELVSTTVMQMDEVTQQNAALVEEATASARSLEDQAVSLAHAVAAFRLTKTRTSGVVIELEPEEAVPA